MPKLGARRLGLAYAKSGTTVIPTPCCSWRLAPRSASPPGAIEAHGQNDIIEGRAALLAQFCDAFAGLGACWSIRTPQR